MKAWGNRCLPKATQNVRVPARHRPEHVCPPAKWTEGDTDAPRPAPNSGPGAEPGQDPGSQGLASGQVAWDPPVSGQVTDGDSHTADDRAREPTALLVQRSCPGPVQTSSPFLSPRALPSPPLSSSPLLSICHLTCQKRLCKLIKLGNSIILYSLVGPNVITKVLISEGGRWECEGQSQRFENATLLALKLDKWPMSQEMQSGL